jgi:hypothetical protein
VTQGGHPALRRFALIGVLASGLGLAAIVILMRGSGPITQPDIPPTSETASASPTDAASVLATGIIQTPQGYSTIDVHEQPTQNSSVVAKPADGTTINILCTAQGDVVTNPDTGQSSSLWDGTSEGYIPDVFVYTGTNQATIGSC